MKHLSQLFVGLITAAASSLLILSAALLALLEGGLNILPTTTALPSNTPRTGETITIAPTATGQTSTQASTVQPTTCPFPAGWMPYTVQVGDTLESLAEMAGITADEIYQRNCLPSRSLVTGSLLYLPLPTPTATLPPVPTVAPTAAATITFTPCLPRPPFGWVPYIVQYGDTLSRLSRDFNVSVTQLMIVNCLTSDRILAGQTLYVPYVPTRTPTRTPTVTITETPTSEPAERVTLTIMQAMGGTITVNPEKPVYYFGDVVTITAVPDTGYSFTGWTGDLSGTTNPTTITMNGNKAIGATFARATVTLTIIQSPGGTVSASPGPYSYGDVVTITAAPDTGYSFTGWTGDLSGATNPTTITMNGNKSIGATFARATVTLTIIQSPGGTIAANLPGPYYIGDVVTITATPDPGYRFTGWGGDCSGAEPICSLTLNGNKTVSATFIQNTNSDAFLLPTRLAFNLSPDSSGKRLTARYLLL